MTNQERDEARAKVDEAIYQRAKLLIAEAGDLDCDKMVTMFLIAAMRAEYDDTKREVLGIARNEEGFSKEELRALEKHCGPNCLTASIQLIRKRVVYAAYWFGAKLDEEENH